MFSLLFIGSGAHQAAEPADRGSISDIGGHDVPDGGQRRHYRLRTGHGLRGRHDDTMGVLHPSPPQLFSKGGDDPTEELRGQTKKFDFYLF